MITRKETGEAPGLCAEARECLESIGAVST